MSFAIVFHNLSVIFFLPLRSLTEKKSQGTSSWNYLTSANFSGFDICFGFVWLKFRYFKRALSVVNALRWVKSKSLAFYKIWQFYSKLKKMYNLLFFLMLISLWYWPYSTPSSQWIFKSNIIDPIVCTNKTTSQEFDYGRGTYVKS